MNRQRVRIIWFFFITLLVIILFLLFLPNEFFKGQSTTIVKVGLMGTFVTFISFVAFLVVEYRKDKTNILKKDFQGLSQDEIEVFLRIAQLSNGGRKGIPLEKCFSSLEEKLDAKWHLNKLAEKGWIIIEPHIVKIDGSKVILAKELK